MLNPPKQCGPTLTSLINNTSNIKGIYSILNNLQKVLLGRGTNSVALHFWLLPPSLWPDCNSSWTSTSEIIGASYLNDGHTKFHSGDLQFFGDLGFSNTICNTLTAINRDWETFRFKCVAVEQANVRRYVFISYSCICILYIVIMLYYIYLWVSIFCLFLNNIQGRTKDL